MELVYLLLGSNLGNRESYLQQARLHIAHKIGEIATESSLYSTESWGKTDQPEFINQVIVVNSALSAEEVLREVLHIEQLLGRERSQKWDSRTIDIDILFYGAEIIDTPDLVIPHPQLHLRNFTLVPLAELSPGLVHPALHLSIEEIIENSSDKLAVKKINH
ncbi:2-amino-4-hydroxy-6-hydroxymethyldihydropteridine diphosphokinase [Hufsiella ginkgonis]|uniref:2-amino-4-hydroxy-6-hydroxymethyldihydropteridine pyrophosphokinase n=1 Tax=Hufsiella ginkgonis TaxID=2695274 RepID=A0A7K1XWM8_9SPHI|nr:2-amino-4-hydroxy-6-hydroxymethyldihydropteridine diphosphokinase [Hufsiella ginkgonis]MXV15385.1 2-amino-4-hydroxy-6-hydroxymethyldihydropteridine diphosphokinase [Hufsiella ginkgonis]